MKIILTVALLMVLLLAGGCRNTNTMIPGEAAAQITLCDAVKIARTAVSGRLADMTPTNGGFQAEQGLNGRWFINYANVNVVFSELGWPGKAEDYFKRYESEQHPPNGVYANVTIFVDGKTGEVTGREINNAYILGPTQNLQCK